MFASDDAARAYHGPESAWPNPASTAPDTASPAPDTASPALTSGPECAPADTAVAPAPVGPSHPQPDSAAVEQPAPLPADPNPPPGGDASTALGWPEDDDPEQWPLADEDPDPEQMAWTLSDDYPGADEADEAAWLASMSPEVRADYLAGPYTGAGEVIPPGFTHRDPGGPSGAGFAAGGALDRLAPGPFLARALADVTASGHDELGESELIGVLLGCQRQVAWSQARLAAAVTALAARRRTQADRPGWSQLGEHVADELAVALRLTGQSAGRLLDVASGLRRLPEVAAALEAGVIDWPKACILVDELALLTDDQARAAVTQLLSRAGEQTTGQLRAATARAVLAADPTAAERRRKEGRKETRVEVWHEPSGNAALAGRELAPADAIAADAALTADADWLRDNGVAGTLAELRATAYLARLSGRDLADLLPRDGGATDIDPDSSGGTGNNRGSGPVDPGSAARGNSADSRGNGSSHGGGGSSGSSARARRGGSIHLTMPLATLAGLADAPGEIAGFGAADAATCRDLAARIGGTGRWCLTVTGPDGRAVGHACAGRRRPDANQPLISWAAGLRGKLQLLESQSCRHPRESTSYAWPRSLRHLIEVRQRTCAAPGCRRPAVRCDIDHTLAFENGGLTCECNGSPLCRQHHRCKQAPGWHLAQDEPGVMTWRLPSGRTYTTAGDCYPG